MTVSPLFEPIDVDGTDFAFDDIPDLHEILAALRRRRPYALVPFAGMRGILLLSHDLVTAAFEDEEIFPAAEMYRVVTEPLLGRTLQVTTGAEHASDRALVCPAFAREVVENHVEPLLRPLAHELVDRFAGRGRAELVTEFTGDFSVRIITRLLGLPADDESDFRRWACAMSRYLFEPEAALKAAAEYTAYLTPVLARRRADPGPDLLSALVSAEHGGRRLGDEEVLAFVRLLFPAGAETAYLGAGSLLYALLTHPDQLERVRADPAGEIGWAVEEALRREPPVALLPRFSLTDVPDWHGLEVPGGTPLVLALASALRDPDRYPDPDRFDVGRRQVADLAFGAGPHRCLGPWLARAQMRVAAEVLLERLPGLTLDAPAGTGEVRIRGMIGAALRGPGRLPVRFRAT